MQITKGLLVEKIIEVTVKENNEPLVEVFETEKIKLLREHKFLSPFLRKTVSNMLIEASNNLPLGHTLLIVTCYRSVEMQKEMYRNRKKQLAKKHPFKMVFQYPLWIKMVNRYTSPPGGSPHHTGGAVDLTVIDPDGNHLDMGTNLTAFGVRVHMENDLITPEQRENRKILRDAMIKVGFIYYPLEWWHYCYGDRMWAAYTEQRESFYGNVKRII
ncbi:D-alanyl-D-alanine carboxypeptidase family protein [Patescibacteria group bacterium]|nr:D-alanyl-D-alanine carboxypeptidase family protein [Patescibacteria group bacterium]